MRGKMWKMTMEIRGNDAGTRDFIHSSGGGVVMSLPTSQLPIVSTTYTRHCTGGDDATTLFDARTPPPSCCSPPACLCQAMPKIDRPKRVSMAGSCAGGSVWMCVDIL